MKNSKVKSMILVILLVLISAGCTSSFSILDISGLNGTNIRINITNMDLDSLTGNVNSMKVVYIGESGIVVFNTSSMDNGTYRIDTYDGTWFIYTKEVQLE